MTVTAPETELRHRLIVILGEEFASEKIVFKNDKLHDSNGQKAAVGGVYPGPSTPASDGLVLSSTVYVQLFNQWHPKVDPLQEVDPSIIEEWAERIRRRCQTDAKNSVPGDSHGWYYEVKRIEYPQDPTGNITRLVATVVAQSQNSALVETTG
jgi:hypothetical protein